MGWQRRTVSVQHRNSGCRWRRPHRLAMPVEFPAIESTKQSDLGFDLVRIERDEWLWRRERESWFL